MGTHASFNDFSDETEEIVIPKKKVEISEEGRLYVCSRCGNQVTVYGDRNQLPSRCQVKNRRQVGLSYHLPCNGKFRYQGMISFRKSRESDILKCALEVPHKGFRHVIHKLYNNGININYDVLAKELNLIYRMEFVC